MRYDRTRVLVTGGLGFIGSNIAVRLAAEGAEVTVVDSAVPGCGGNEKNIEGAGVRYIRADIGDTASWKEAARGTDVVFNLAGEISHINSMRDPMRDLELNTTAQLRFLLCLREVCPGVRVVYASTRQVYGVPQYLPITESHPVNPIDFNGVHKNAAASYHRILTASGEIDACILRLTNIYGPRMALHIPEQGVLGHFFRRALLGEEILVFGDGQQLRDPVYVDDAVDAFLLAGGAEKLPHRYMNVGGAEPLRMLDMARVLADAGGCDIRMREFPEGHKAIDIGSYSTDWSRIRESLGWRPRVLFEEGVRKTLAFFRQHIEDYLGSADWEKYRARTTARV